MNTLLRGCLAGLAATVPMTVVMEVMYRRLPLSQRYPLPPRQITMRVVHEAGLQQELDEEERVGVTLASHFAYGSAAGGVYSGFSGKIPGHPSIKGAAYGLLVWGGSYLLGLPGLGLLRPATQHPAQRNALMIAAHIVWGATLGLLVEHLPSNDGRE